MTLVSTNNDHPRVNVGMVTLMAGYMYALILWHLEVSVTSKCFCKILQEGP